MSRRLIPVLPGPAIIMAAAPHRPLVRATAAPVLRATPDPPVPSWWTSAPSTHALTASAAASGRVIGACVFQVRISSASTHTVAESLPSLPPVVMATASCVLRAQTSLSVKCDCSICAAGSVYPLISPRSDERCPTGPLCSPVGLQIMLSGIAL